MNTFSRSSVNTTQIGAPPPSNTATNRVDTLLAGLGACVDQAESMASALRERVERMAGSVPSNTEAGAQIHPPNEKAPQLDTFERLLRRLEDSHAAINEQVKRL